MLPQECMQQRLKEAGIPYKEIKVFGGHVIITAWSLDAAGKWVDLLQQFAMSVRGPVESLMVNKRQKGTRLLERHSVWTVGARIA